MSNLFLILLSVLGGLLILWGILWVVLSRVRKRLSARIINKFNPHEMIAATTNANFFGIQSKGGRQLRGNGALVLTHDQIYFLRAVPQTEFVVPLDTITKITMPKSVNGKSIFRPLLCVHFNGPYGEDSMAWAVKQPQTWKAAIQELIDHEPAESASDPH